VRHPDLPRRASPRTHAHAFATVKIVAHEQEPDDKRMRLRYAGACRLCNEPRPAGAEAVYERGAKTVRCVECRGTTTNLDPVTSTNVGPGATVSVDPGTAGASARREHDRRAAKREARIRTAHPKLGGLILALSNEPQSTRAWEVGAIGEEMLADRLRTLPTTFRVLHDRRIPGTRANIDHIVVGPTAVWVIDAKRYKGKRPSLQVEGGLFRPRVESLRIGGRDGTPLVAGVRGQVERVEASLGATTVSVTGALCFLDADWPLLGGSFTVGGIEVVSPGMLVKRMTQATTVPIDVDGAYACLASRFPPA